MPFTTARTLLICLGVASLSLSAVTAASARYHPDPMSLENAQQLEKPSTLKWDDMINRLWAFSPIAEDACAKQVGRDCRLGEWQRFIDKARKLPKGEQIQSVQAYVNRVPYRSDDSTWGKSDYWAAPGEFFARGGDCEDFAIAKYLSLRNLGFDPADMRILVLSDTRRRLTHAVLLLSFAGDTLVLDNNNRRVLSWKQVPQFRPIYSVSESALWVYPGRSLAELRDGAVESGDAS